MLTIRLLGPVDIRVGGVPLAVDTRKATALLAHLAVAGRPVSREELAAFLWPDADGASARGALRRTLSVLNAALGGVALSIQRSTVQLENDAIDVDWCRFQSLLSRVRAHGHGPDVLCDDCVAALEEATALDRGDFMAGFSLRDSDEFDGWQLGEGEAYRRDLAGALERLARARAAASAWNVALDVGRRWLALDPLHEPAHRLVMLALARVGEPAAAVRQFRECVRILDAELGVAPLEETTALYEEIRAGRVAPAPRVVGPAPEPETPTGAVVPLVGRDGDLDALQAGYRSIGPDGRLFVIEGEPGIGKTRLAGAIAETVRAAGGVVLIARAYAGEETIPYGPIAALIRAGLETPGASERLRSVRPDLRAAVGRLMPLPADPGQDRQPGELRGRPDSDAPDPFGRAQLLDGLAEVLAALTGGPVPGMLLVDDLDWADLSTVDAVAYLVRRLQGRPIAILATWRPLDPADAQCAQLLGIAGREGRLVRTALHRLTREEVASLAIAVLGAGATDELVDAVFAESEGLPLYVTEALAAAPSASGSIPVPSGVRALLQQRISSVGELAAQVLAAGSVIGRSFDFDTLKVASGRSEEEVIAGVEELVRRGILTEAGLRDGDVRFDFTHGRLRGVAYDALGLVRRRLLHRRVAEALRAAGVSGGEPGVRWARIAHHEQLAGRLAEAADAHRRAGEEARAVFAQHEARAHLEAALALRHPATAQLHEALGEVLTLLGDYRGAIAHLEAAAAIADPEREWSIERRLALVYTRLADWGRAASHMAAALAAAPEEPAVRSALLADRGAVVGRAGDGVAAIALAREALALAERAGDRPGIARACQVLGWLARGEGDLDAARDLLERALEASAEAPDPGLRIAALNTLALTLATIGERDRPIAFTLEALERCERMGDRHRQAALENNLADLLRAAGRRDEAMVHLKRAVAIFADVGGGPGVLEPEIWKLVEW